MSENTPERPQSKAAPTQPSLRRTARASGIVVRPDVSADGPRWVLTGPIFACALVLGLTLGKSCARMFVGEASSDVAAGPAPSAEIAPSASIEPIAPAPSPSPSAKPSVAEQPTYAVVTVGKSQLMHCQDPPAAELTPSRCGEPGLDPLLVPMIEGLSSCAGAAGVAGKLSLTLDLSFGEGKKDIRKVLAGRSSQITRGGRRDDRAINPVLDCLRKSLPTLTVPDSAKTHVRWVIAYPVTLAAPAVPTTAAAPSGSLPSERPVSGSSVVQVDTAIVRDAPSTSGAPIGRLSRGTKVTTIGTSGHWYHIKYGENDASEGWIFRTNIGR